MLNRLNLSIDGLDYLKPNFDLRNRNLALKNDFLKYKEWYEANKKRLVDEIN